MPRNEGFLDPGAGPLASFAWDLRALREQAGRAPYRVLAKRAGFCASTLSVAASGAKLPSLDVTLAYVQACGGDPETWGARWHELAAQFPPAHSGPNAAPGLHVAPPYDADERGEPAQLAAVALAAPTDGSRPSDLAAPEAQERVPVVAHDDVRLEPLPQAAAAARADRGDRPRRRTRLAAVPISRAATVALTLVTAILGMRVMSEGTGNAPAAGPALVSAGPTDTPMQQADALYALIYQFTPWRLDTSDALGDLSGCRNLSNAQTRLRTIARKRQEQVEQLAVLNVSKIPGSAGLVDALKHAWITSAQSDTAYANIAADLQPGCTSGAVTTDPNYQQADADARAAAAAKNEAARLWNANADALGQLPLAGSEL